MKQLAGGKHMENDCFPRTLKFEMFAIWVGTQTTSYLQVLIAKSCYSEICSMD
jgi:hypothetical protein